MKSKSSTDGSSFDSQFPLDTVKALEALFRMTIILVLALALGAGMLIRSRWALLLPLGIGALAALAIVLRAGGLGDTPIPFLVVVCTLVMIGGQGLRPRINAPAS